MFELSIGKMFGEGHPKDFGVLDSGLYFDWMREIQLFMPYLGY